MTASLSDAVARPTPWTSSRFRRSIEVTFTNGKLPFTDVRESDWFYDDVAFAIRKRPVLRHKRQQTFQPERIHDPRHARHGSLPARGRTHRHRQKQLLPMCVPAAYYEKAVIWAADNGIVTGT